MTFTQIQQFDFDIWTLIVEVEDCKPNLPIHLHQSGCQDNLQALDLRIHQSKKNTAAYSDIAPTFKTYWQFEDPREFSFYDYNSLKPKGICQCFSYTIDCCAGINLNQIKLSDYVWMYHLIINKTVDYTYFVKEKQDKAV